jgi:predicted metal-dependent peptidase
MREFKKRDEKTRGSIAKAESALSGAKIRLLMDFPLFGHIAIRMAMKPTYDIPTTAVDQYMSLWYNPDWVNSLTKIDHVHEVAHEVGHIIQSLFNRTPKLVVYPVWNKAADELVDTMLHDAGIMSGERTRQFSTPEIRAAAKAAKTTEVRYYQLLEEMGKSQCPGCAAMAQMAINGELTECGGEGEKGKEIPEHTCGQQNCCCTASMMGQQKMTEAEKVDVQTKWQQVVIHAAMKAKEKGSIPGPLEEFLASLSRPKVNWRDHIRVLATSVFPDRYTYYKVSRRSHAMGLSLPGRTRATKGAIGVFDTSGSMSDQEVNACLSEFVGLMDQCGCPSLEVIFHDSVVYYQGEASKADLTKMKIQRGGTDHRPVFELLNSRNRKEKPAMVVCFTDLETSFPDQRPQYPVLWCCPEANKEHTVPWGKKVPVDMSSLKC